MRQFGLSSKEAFDFIAAGQQRGLDQTGDFLESVTEYSTQFSNAGADAAEFFSVLETGLANGNLGTDKAADAFKEFNVRILDGSKTTADGLAQIGLDVDDFTQRITSGQIDVQDAFQEVINRLRDTDDAAIQMQAGVALIGTQFEDLGATAALSIDTAATSMEDLAGATESLNAVSETSTARINSAFRELDGILRDATGPAFTALGNIAASVLEGIVDAINQVPVAWELLNRSAQLAASYIDQAFSTVFNAARESLAFLLDKAATATFYIPGLSETSAQLREMSSGFKQAVKDEADFAAIRKQITSDSLDRIDALKDEQGATVESIRINKQAIEVDKARAEEIKKQRSALEAKAKAEDKAAKAEKEAIKVSKARQKELEKQNREEERRKQSIDDYLLRLAEEAALVGKSKAEIAAYELAKKGANAETIKTAQALIEQKEAHEEQIKAQDRAAKEAERAAAKMRDAYTDAFADANNALGDFLGNLFDGSKSFKDSLKDLGKGLLSSGLQQLQGGGGGLLGGLLGGGGSGGGLLGGLLGGGGSGGGVFDVLTGGGITGGGSGSGLLGGLLGGGSGGGLVESISTGFSSLTSGLTDSITSGLSSLTGGISDKVGDLLGGAGGGLGLGLAGSALSLWVAMLAARRLVH